MTTVLDMLGGETVVRWRPTYGADGHGNQTVTDWTPKTIRPAQVDIVGSSELLGGRDTVIENAVARLPYGTDVTAADRIEWRGNRYDIAGAPAPIRNRYTPLLSRLEVNLTRRY